MFWKKIILEIEIKIEIGDDRWLYPIDQTCNR